MILLNELRKIQKKQGYISEDSMKDLAVKTQIPISRIYSVASFHSMFFTEKQGKYVIEICNSPSCFLNNSTEGIDFLKKRLKLQSGQSSRKFSLHICSCIGCCDTAPVMRINGKLYRNLTKEKINGILEKCKY